MVYVPFPRISPGVKEKSASQTILVLALDCHSIHLVLLWVPLEGNPLHLNLNRNTVDGR